MTTDASATTPGRFDRVARFATSRRIAAIVVAYQVHATILGLVTTDSAWRAAFPEASVASAAQCAAASMVSGYVAACVAGDSRRTAHVRATALALVAVIAAVQQFDGTVGTRFVAQVVGAPACLVGAAWHRAHQDGRNRDWWRRPV